MGKNNKRTKKREGQRKEGEHTGEPTKRQSREVEEQGRYGLHTRTTMQQG